MTGPLNLDTYLGQTVEEFCGKYGKSKDGINHCAHFTSHVLGMRVSGAALCSNVGDSTWAYEDRRKGFCVRVNQVFNACNNREYLLEEPSGTQCFVCATVKGNIESKKPLTIGAMSNKHIGIYSGGLIYHYANTQDKVVKWTIKEFSAYFKGNYGGETVLLRCDLP